MANTDFLERMAKLLALVGQPVELKKIASASVILLGPYYARTETVSIGHYLSICRRRQMQLLMKMPLSHRDALDFQIRCPFIVAPERHEDVAWLISWLNLWLPLGCFQLTLQGRLIYSHDLALQQEVTAAVFLETCSLLLDGFRQCAPLLQAVALGQLQAEEVRLWLCGKGIRPLPLQQVLRPQPRRRLTA